MTVLASSRSHIALTSLSALARSAPASSNSMVLPTRTPATSPKPSPCKAPSMALPWTSSTPGLRKTSTLAFIRNSSLQLAALDHRRHLAHDAQAPRDLGIALDDIAQIAAEAVLVQLFVGLAVPQPA